MYISSYEIIYLMYNACATYIIYLYFKIFFEQRKSSTKQEFFSYVLFYVMTTSATLMGANPIVLIMMNIALLLLISFNYKSNIIQKITSVLLIYIIFWAVEVIIVLVTTREKLNIYQQNEYSSGFGLILITLISFVLVNIFKRLTNLKKGEKTPLLYWIVMTLIPIMSIYIGNIIFSADNLDIKGVIVSAIWIFAINIETIVSYDIAKGSTENKIKNIYIQEQTKYYENEFRLIEKQNKNIQKVKHDIKNHLYAINILAKENQTKEIIQYIKTVEKTLLDEEKIITTNNLILDGIINYKISEAKGKGITVEPSFQIPENIQLPSTELIIVLGNLLDNAIEATEKISQEVRPIYLAGKYEQSNLVIIIKNSYKVLNSNRLNLETTKKNKLDHGMGISNARQAAQKIGGEIFIKNINDMFTVEIIIPCKLK